MKKQISAILSGCIIFSLIIEKEQNRIFAEVWEEDSYVLDHIIAAKETEAQQGERSDSE